MWAIITYMEAIKIRKIGNSLGIILPKELLKRYQLALGDSLYIWTEPDGFGLTPYDPQFARAMEAFTHTRQKYRNALHILKE